MQVTKCRVEARATFALPPNLWAIVCASVHARFADAGLISKSVYPFAARHHSRSCMSAFAVGSSSCSPRMLETSVHDIVSD